jgi:hypothetical protein
MKLCLSVLFIACGLAAVTATAEEPDNEITRGLTTVIPTSSPITWRTPTATTVIPTSSPITWRPPTATTAIPTSSPITPPPTPNPTDSPSEIPSSSHFPSQIPTPTPPTATTAIPTSSPITAIPTSSPIIPPPTQTPTDSPSGVCELSIDGYLAQGQGQCLDGSDNLYRFIRFNSITSFGDCATKCDCIASKLSGFQGFDRNSQTNECNCLLGKGIDRLGVIEAAKTACSAFSYEKIDVGQGFIMGVNDSNNFCCFKDIKRKTGQSCASGSDCRSTCCGDANDGNGKVCYKLGPSNNYFCPYPPF